ncbi:MAG: serine/threonine-protein kinase [Planctomycetota bacterium]
MKLARPFLGYLATGVAGDATRSSRRRPSPRGPRLRRGPSAGARFQAVQVLGRGSQGWVHLCFDRQSRDYVAVKVAHHDRKALAATEREARALWTLRHSPSVPRIRTLLYRGGKVSGFVSSFVEGVTLDDFELNTEREAALLAVRLTEAVLDVLRRGFLHRDIKPQNVLVTSVGTVRLIDFGLSCLRSNAPSGVLSGTIKYASPEQLRAEQVGARSDLFSLGLLLAELTSGEPFFNSEVTDFQAFVESRDRRLKRRGRRLHCSHPMLNELISRLLDPDPEKRAGINEVSSRIETLRLDLGSESSGSKHGTLPIS